LHLGVSELDQQPITFTARAAGEIEADDEAPRVGQRGEAGSGQYCTAQAQTVCALELTTRVLLIAQRQRGERKKTSRLTPTYVSNFVIKRRHERL
jgi:hypothetical protein